MVNYSNKCMGCGGCVVACPQNAVQLKRNENGFYQAYVDDNLCVNCSICDHVCPINNKSTVKPILAYSYQSKDIETLGESASGGFAFDAGKQLQEEGYPICNVQYDVMARGPLHKVIFNKSELKNSRNSIYLQSYPVDGFRDILKQNKGVIIGSPCQIATMNNILQKRGKRDEFVLIDFFCHGVPSYNLWIKYMEDYFKHKSVENPKVQFRCKKYGWGNYTLRFQSDNQLDYIDYARDKDIFYKMFLENMVLNESCYTCPYYGETSSADIRMGDFWGEKYKEDTKGVSALLVYTEKGKEVIDSLKSKGRIEEENTEDILKEQRKAVMHKPSCREAMLKALSGKSSLNTINKTLVFRYKCMRRIKNIFRRG